MNKIMLTSPVNLSIFYDIRNHKVISSTGKNILLKTKSLNKLATKEYVESLKKHLIKFK